MARKSKLVTVRLEGRDYGKQFLITEMPASQAEKWAARAFLALAHSGVDIPEDVQGAGIAGLAVIGLQALGRVQWFEAEPLLDEMMGCVQAIRDPNHPSVTLPLIEDDMEEVATRAWIRSEIFEIHTSFSLADAISTSQPVAPAQNSNATSTSLSRSVQ